MHILPTDLNIFPKVLIRRICLTIRSFLSWWSFPFGECYSRLGILGLQRCAQRFDCHEYVKKILWRFLSLPPEPPGPPSKENVKKKKTSPQRLYFLTARGRWLLFISDSRRSIDTSIFWCSECTRWFCGKSLLHIDKRFNFGFLFFLYLSSFFSVLLLLLLFKSFHFPGSFGFLM